MSRQHYNREDREGLEYHILVVVVTLAFLILVQGAGAVSIEHLVSSRYSSRNG